MTKQVSATSHYLLFTTFVLVAWFFAFNSYHHLGVTHRSILTIFSNSQTSQQQVSHAKGAENANTSDLLLKIGKNNTFNSNKKINKIYLNSQSSPSSDALKIILLWSTWSSTMADEPLVKARCPVTSCIFTADMSLIQQSDVVVLYVDTLTDFPLNRRPHQRFVFAQLESPDNTKMATINDPRLRYDYFNWTMTYRRDSDIFLRDYYGSVIKANNSSKWNSNMNTVKSYNISLEMAALIRGKSKLVAWFVAHCSTPIRREEYVRQLSQFVTVDVYGRCGKDCPSNCDDLLRTDYKFYLAFENSWCPDYVTEKFIRPLVYDSVPIVLGGADYTRFAPPHSYINARDFDSPKELADYLTLLDKSDDLYARYFDWKRDYDITLLDLSGWCELCRMAHDDTLPAKVYHDIKQWWMLDDGECESDSTKYF